MKLPTNLPELIQYTAEQAQEKAANRLAEAQLKLLTTTYDKAATYTTVIIFGGYAGAFGLWQLTKDELTRSQVLWSALFLSISLATFVTFEVTKMILVSKQMFKKAAALKKPENRRSLQKLVTVLDEMEQAYVASFHGLYIFWMIAVSVSVVGALGGAGILVYAFLSGLVQG